MYETALNELRERWREGHHNVAKEDILRWSASSGLSVSSVFDRLAIELSSDFFVGFLGWEFVDLVANRLYGVMFDFADSDPDFINDKNEIVLPSACFEFYCAFDHSEFEGPRDRELIREFLQKHWTLVG